MILKTGEIWEPEEERIHKWQQTYPNIQVRSELLKMAAWLDANPAKRKTERGMARFVNSWLSRANDTGSSIDIDITINKTRDMSSMDDLSHNFVDCPNIRQSFIAKYGQSFENGKRIEYSDTP